MNAGYICIAQNSNTVDYLQMAYLQALSCKLTQTKNANFSIIVDTETSEQITDAQQNNYTTARFGSKQQDKTTKRSTSF